MTEQPSTAAVSPNALDNPYTGPEPRAARRIRIGRHRDRPEVYVESNRLARLIGLVLTIVIVIGTTDWWQEAGDRWAVPDSVRPWGFRAPQRVIALAGITAAVVQTAYLFYFTVTGRTWRYWRGVAIVFGVLVSISVGLWLIDRFLLNEFFGPWA